MLNYLELIELCKDKRVYIQTHNYPDPDALASGFGLSMWFKQYKINSVLCFDGQLDKRACNKMIDYFHIEAVHVSKIKFNEEGSFLLCVDTQKGSGNITPLSEHINACIDHHPVFLKSKYDYSDLRISGSCSSIVADYFHQSGIIPSADTASALLYGIKIDTRNFSRGVTELDIEMFQFLNKFCNLNDLKKITSNVMSFEDLKAYTNAIETLRVYGRTGFAEIEFPCSDDIIAMISDFFLSLDEIDLCVVFSKRKDGIKLSIRSERDEIHAGNWANMALDEVGTGGGHSYMAGGFIPLCNLDLLGQYPIDGIESLFMKALKSIREENNLY